MLDLLDKELESRGHKFVRYADDISIFTSSQRGAERILASLIRLDEWMQVRLRMCIWKQWKRVRTRIKNLQKLGASKQKAYEWGNTRKGYWRTAHSPILQSTVTIERLKQKGYVSLMDTYTLRRKTLVNRRDTRTVRPVV